MIFDKNIRKPKKLEKIFIGRKNWGNRNCLLGKRSVFPGELPRVSGELPRVQLA
jgi:hypothetical protein